MVRAFQQLARPAHVNAYSVAGLSFCVDSDHAEVLNGFDRQFTGSHFSRTTETSEAWAKISLFVSKPPIIPTDLETFAIDEDGRCLIEGDTYHIVYGNSLVSIINSSPLRVNVWLGDLHAGGADLARIFFTATAALLRRCGRYEMHAACVVAPDSNKGVLLVGPSGSGKSTLTAQLAASGWHYLSDDSIVLSAGSSGTEAHALRRVFAITEDAIRAGGLQELEVGLQEPMALDPTKRRLDPFDVLPDRFLSSCFPSVLLFPLVTNNQRTTIDIVAPSIAMTLLIRLCPWGTYDRIAARGYVNALAALAKRCGAYHLYLGEDLFGDREQTDHFFRGLLRSTANL